MFFKQLSAKESTLSYFLGCGTLGKAVAVDVVAGDEQWFIDQAAHPPLGYAIFQTRRLEAFFCQEALGFNGHHAKRPATICHHRLTFRYFIKPRF